MDMAKTYRYARYLALHQHVGIACAAFPPAALEISVPTYAELKYTRGLPTMDMTTSIYAGGLAIPRMHKHTRDSTKKHADETPQPPR
jgi:hypothetical protein